MSDLYWKRLGSVDKREISSMVSSMGCNGCD